MSERHILTATLQGQSQATYLEQLNNSEFWEYAARLATVPPASAEQIEAYLECELQHGRCILPLNSMREVISKPHPVTIFPATPDWMFGVMAWRSETIPVIDLDAYLTGHVARAQNGSMLIVVQYDEILLGLRASIIGTLTTLEQDQLQISGPVPDWCAHVPGEILAGFYGGALVLHIPALLIDMIKQIKAVTRHE